jgi:hypothetical protein
VFSSEAQAGPRQHKKREPPNGNGSRAGSRVFAQLGPVLAKQPSGRPVDEMKPRTGLADHRFIGGIRIIRLGLVQPVLNVQSRAGTPEDDVIHRSQK